jgi:ribosomal protein S1
MPQPPLKEPELEAFLASLRPGQILTGTIAAIHSRSVDVALDDGPCHPFHPGVGYILDYELSWRWFTKATDVEVGQRVSGAFLEVHTKRLQARLSLRAAQPDPFQTFADATPVGQELRGRVVKLLPFGVWVEISEGVEGLVHGPELTAERLVAVGDEITVVVNKIDREQRRLYISRKNG